MKVRKSEDIIPDKPDPGAEGNENGNDSVIPDKPDPGAEGNENGGIPATYIYGLFIHEALHKASCSKATPLEKLLTFGNLMMIYDRISTRTTSHITGSDNKVLINLLNWVRNLDMDEWDNVYFSLVFS